MKRLTNLAALSSIVALSLPLSTAACAGKQKQDDPQTMEVPPPAETIPTCGGWIVVVERPVVSTGSFSADGLLGAVLDGMSSGGCTGQTSTPAGTPAPVLKISLRASGVGTGGVLMMLVTDASTGELKWRFQEKVGSSAEMNGAASSLGLKIATELGS